MKLYKFTEPKHPGPNATLGELFEYGQQLLKVQHLRPGFLPKGTRVKLHDGSRATVTNFVPYDGWNLGVQVDGLPNEGRITLRSEVVVLSSK